MTSFTEPMLCASLLPPEVECTDAVVYEAMKKLRYPVLASLKVDGIRALRLNGTLLSRKLKRIPNKEICSASTIMPGGFDMELWTPELEYNDIQSIVMSHVHSDWIKIKFYVLDRFFPERPDLGYAQRLDEVAKWIDSCSESTTRLRFNIPIYCRSAKELFEFEKKCIEEQGEGICFRTPNSPYKMGRSTLEEQYLVKLSRSVRDECIIIGFKEQMENGNRESRNALGHMDRSHSIENMTGKNTLGAFIVRNTAGQEFPIGTGVNLTNKFRKWIWENQDQFLGQIWTYKSKAHGKKLLPRQPILVGPRNKIDL